MSSGQSIRMQQAVQAQTAGNLAVAESAYRGLLADKAVIPEVLNNLGMICLQTDRRPEALSLFKKALAVDPAFPDARMHLATIYEQAGDSESAINCYRKILSRHPGMFVARYLLANQLKARGQLDEALSQYRKVMQQQPGYTQAHFSYSGVHKYGDASDPHITAMLGLYQNEALGVENRIHLAFALAKAHEDIGDYSRAFGFLKDGNDLRSRKYDYSIDGDRALISNIMETFTAETMENLDVTGQASNRPIFILGMPRSGTTLVEKIIASHSDVFAGGELDYMYSLGVSKFLSRTGDFLFRPLDSYPTEDFESTGEAYLEKLGRLDKECTRITDKLPFNFQMIGLIKIALPNARIIHCVRDPRDTCLSIYKQNFSTENYRFAYDLESVGQFHNLYRQLMAHWHRVMPGAIYDIEYEALTRDPESEIRKLLSACDLEWQDACLDFHESKGLVKTASSYQVRQPMYTSSVRLWERYRAHLGPLLNALAMPENHDGMN